MTDDDIRRAVLRTLIKRRFNDISNQFAVAVSKPPGQINDMLSTPARKSFGVRIARQFENTLGLGRFFFEDIKNAEAGGTYSQISAVTDLGVNEPVVSYSDLNDDEQTLINGYRNAPEEVRRHLVGSVIEYVKTLVKTA